LLVQTPAHLQAHHTNGKKQARAVASPCAADNVREFGPKGGIGTYADVCFEGPEAARGGWTQNDKVYLLEISSPSDSYETPKARLRRFVAVAEAISANAAQLR
jgi:hypothetical protein